MTDTEDTINIQNLNGNLVAQNNLYIKYKKILNDYIKYKYPKHKDVDDDVAEILTKIFLNIEKFDNNKSKFKSWCLSIANNHMIDKWRNNSTYKLCLDKKNTNTVSEDINNLMSYFNTNNTLSESNNLDVNSSINYISSQISEDDFKYLNLKYIEGYNYSEIGDFFNVTSSTVSNRVNYIKTKLKKNNKEIIFD